MVAAVTNMLLASYKPPVVITFQTSAVDATSQTTYTYTSQTIGTATPERVVIVGIWGRAAGTGKSISSVTIGGISATQIAAANDAPTDTTSVALFAANVPTGTTATVVITMSAAYLRSSLFVWAMTGTKGAVTAKATISNAVNANPMSGSLNTNFAGAAVAVAADGSGGSTTYTWSGVTIDSQAVVVTNSSSAAHVNNTTGSSLAISATYSAAPTDAALAAASW